MDLKQAKVYVAGHRGLVGSALMRALKQRRVDNIVTRTHGELDLTDQTAVRDFFDVERPHYVFLAAAKVGGIHANSTYPGDFIYNNLAVQNNVISAAKRSGVARLLFLGSSCIYPRDCPQPIKESYWMSGPLENTNRAYAVAKIAGIETCWAFNRQYGTLYLSVMPTNLYGPGDSYDLQNSHVLPALMRKTHEAKSTGAREVVVWGTGRARREFLYVDDMADACVFLMSLEDGEYIPLVQSAPLDAGVPPMLNIGAGTDVSIKELAQIVAGVVGFQGDLAFDTSKPDGTPRKLLDVSRMRGLGWQARTGLKEGIELAYRAYMASLEQAALTS